MHFVLATGWEEGVADLAECLVHELAAGKKVLWLVSGGSNIDASVEAMHNISPRLSKNLTIMLVDERQGAAGHRDSNWHQLLKAGLKAKKATLLPVLVGRHSLEENRTRYDDLARQALTQNEVVIAQLGIGPDGHIAGILPDSVAARDKKALVVGYQSEPYDRLTFGFEALMQINLAYVFAFGENKAEALRSLRNKKLPLTKQPAQILKQMGKVRIYNDQVGGRV